MKRNIIKSSIKLFIVFVLMSGSLYAQESVQSLIKDVKGVMQDAIEAKAEFLSPDNFFQGKEALAEAEQDYKNGESFEDVVELVNSARTFFEKSLEAAKVGDLVFNKTMAAKSDAIEVEASKYAVSKWEQAEKTFKEGSREVESGDLADAKELSVAAEKLYRESELEAIKAHYLKDTWDLQKQADEMDVADYSPKTLKASKELIQRAEKELIDSRYDTDVARKLAIQAHYEVNHAIYMSDLIRKYISEDKTWEDLQLNSEKPLTKIAQIFNIPPKYDRDFNEVTDEIIKNIEMLNNKIERLTSENSDLEAENAVYKTQLSSLSDQKTQISQKLDELEKTKQTFENTQNLFNPSQAEVLKKGDNIVIRLYGLKFDSGQSIIDPGYYSLLTSVKKAIEFYPNSKVRIEGHTDSRGNDEVNIQLSQDRAASVYQYLLNTMNISPDRITAMGFGETMPIANNESADGREKKQTYGDSN